MQELLAAADAEHRHVALERATGDGEFEIGARCLEFDGVVPVLGTEQGGIDVEVAAGDDQSVDGVEVCGRPPGRVRQEHGQSTRAVDAGAVVLANGIPWLVGIAARLFGIEREADRRCRHLANLCGAAPGDNVIFQVSFTVASDCIARTGIASGFESCRKVKPDSCISP